MLAYSRSAQTPGASSSAEFLDLARSKCPAGLESNYLRFSHSVHHAFKQILGYLDLFYTRLRKEQTPRAFRAQCIDKTDISCRIIDISYV